MDLKNNIETVNFLEESIFPNIYNENTILFLGAGFSYTKEKNYLGSTLINYYQDKLGLDLETRDLVEFVDRASRLDNFSREQFDQYVKGLLQRLKPDNTHKKVVGMGWRQIVTTNLDLLLENSYADIQGKTEEYKEIVPIRSVQEYYKTVSNDQIKYIKLNGCLSDISKYKMVFSTQDFANNKKFYNDVITNFSSLTNDVCFLSIGYSFTDGISKRLLTELNKNNLKNDRKIFNVDPFPNEAIIPYLLENNVITIRMTGEEFFNHYQSWIDAKYKRQEHKIPKAYFKTNDNPVQINTQLKLRLLNKLNQLHVRNKEFIKAESYYKGEEPNYSVILDNYDVIKKEVNKSIIESVLTSKIDNNLIPVNFIVGDNGIGKSTSTLRAINNLQTDYGFIAFDLIEINGIRAQDLEELFSASSSENIILLADNIERHTFFKELMAFRLMLSEYQFNRNISILAPIRENILEKYLRNYKYQNISKIAINHSLNNDEIIDLVNKLKYHKLINVRDKQEEIKIIDKIKKSYNSDPYVTMLSLIENSTLLRVISDNLSQINDNAKIAFEFTSLLYQFKIPMPASILKKIINVDWDEFKNNILKVDCKGLLLNHIERPEDIKEDLVFKTKHRIISAKFIENRYKSEDALLKSFLKIIRVLNPNDQHVKIAIDLFKAIRKNNIFTEKDKLYKLYDEASLIFTSHPSFNIHYARNLQQRKNITSLKKAAERLMQVDSLSDKRNFAITHTRGIIDFEIAKYHHKNEDYYIRDEYLESAKEFFEIKLTIDPFSSYSYYDFLALEMWKIKELELDSEEIFKQHLIIQDLFVKAYESVVENTEYIEKLRSKYVNEIKVNQFSKVEIIKQIEDLYSNSETRVIALIFKLNSIENEILEFGNIILPNLTLSNIVEELNEYSHLDIAKKAIFNYHCNRLYDIDSRVALNKFNSEQIKDLDFFKYHFYSFIKECYNQQFSYAQNHLYALKKEYKYLNPSIVEYWIDSETLKPKTFTCVIKTEIGYKVYIPILGGDFYRYKADFEFKKGKQFYCNIIFTVRGIRVQIIGEKVD